MVKYHAHFLVQNCTRIKVLSTVTEQHTLSDARQINTKLWPKGWLQGGW